MSLSVVAAGRAHSLALVAGGPSRRRRRLLLWGHDGLGTPRIPRLVEEEEKGGRGALRIAARDDVAAAVLGSGPDGGHELVFWRISDPLGSCPVVPLRSDVGWARVACGGDLCAALDRRGVLHAWSLPSPFSRDDDDARDLRLLRDPRVRNLRFRELAVSRTAVLLVERRTGHVVEVGDPEEERRPAARLLSSSSPPPPSSSSSSSLPPVVSFSAVATSPARPFCGENFHMGIEAGTGRLVMWGAFPRDSAAAPPRLPRGAEKLGPLSAISAGDEFFVALERGTGRAAVCPFAVPRSLRPDLLPEACSFFPGPCSAVAAGGRHAVAVAVAETTTEEAEEDAADDGGRGGEGRRRSPLATWGDNRWGQRDVSVPPGFSVVPAPPPNADGEGDGESPWRVWTEEEEEWESGCATASLTKAASRR